jgi:HSP20 family protein
MFSAAYISIRLDLRENDEENTITATFELPGFKIDDIHIRVQNGTLTVMAEKTPTSAMIKPQDVGYTLRERHVGKYHRTLELPPGIKVCTSRDGLQIRF